MPAVSTSREELPLLLNMKQVGEILGLSKDRTYRLPHIKGFPILRLGNALRVPRDKFFEWVDTQSELGVSVW